MRSYFFIIIFLIFSFTSFSQKPKPGTYVYKYYDLEYGKVIAACKIVIQKDSIAIYASKELAKRLTNLKDGQIIEKGILQKNKSGRWFIIKNIEEGKTIDIDPSELSYIDFDKKIYYTL